MSLLNVRELETSFGLRKKDVIAVAGVTLTVEAGECVGVVGESGCGKTTTGLSVMRLLPRNGRITGGAIDFEGRDLASLSEETMQTVRGNDIALIPQDPMTSLNPVKRIGDQIAEGFILHGLGDKKAAYERAVEVLRLVEMPEPEARMRQYPHELSGGLRQRVMIAMALVCSPKILVADEPTTALDVTIQAQILNLLDSLREKMNMAVILITHDMGVIASRTDRVVVMYAGKVVEEAPTTAIFASSRHPYTQALLASVPRLDITVERLNAIPGLPPDLSETIVGCRFAPRCSFATDDCRQVEPPTQTDGASHSFACFHPVNGPLQATPVTIRTADAVGATSPALVSVDHLVKEFPLRKGLLSRSHSLFVSAVADVSFEIGEGETFGLVGESGCGKTTIGRMITGLEEPTSGTISFPGFDPTGKKKNLRLELARMRQMMFQDPYASLDPRKRVRDIIREPLEIQQSFSAAAMDERVRELFDMVGLSPSVMERYPHEFSGGQRQRIGLARALALKPRLIIADEPVSALDVSIQAQILNLMKDLQEQSGVSYMLISHDLAVVRHIANRIGVMYLGKLVEVGPASEVFSNPSHPYTRALLNAVPSLDDREAAKARANTIVGDLPSAINPPSGCRFRTRCAFATDRCAEETPVAQPVGIGHQVACHFPLTA